MGHWQRWGLNRTYAGVLAFGFILFLALLVFLLAMGMGFVSLCDMLSAPSWRARGRSLLAAILSFGVCAGLLAIGFGTWTALGSFEMPVPN